MELNHENPPLQTGSDAVTSGPLKHYFSPIFDEQSPPFDFVPSGISRLTRKKAPSSLLISSKEVKKSSEIHPKGVNNQGLSTKTDSEIHTTGKAVTTSYVSPIFHFTSHDTKIIAIAHNNHYKLMAISTSRREIYVTLTQELPVMENMGAIKSFEDFLGSAGGLSGSGMPPPPFMNECLFKWDPIEMTVLVDQLRHPCTQVEWGPWQYGVCLAGLCPGWQLRIYRFSHSLWALEAALNIPNGISIAFSSQCMLACACNSGEILLFVRHSDSSGDVSPWVSSCRFFTGLDGSSIPTFSQNLQLSTQDPDLSATTIHLGSRDFTNPALLSTNTGVSQNDTLLRCVCVSFDDTGSLLACGYQYGSVSVFFVVDGGTQIRNAFFSSDSTHRSDVCRQVVWAPSSGRKFLILAIVYTNYFTILLFQRPSLHSLSSRKTGLPTGAYNPFSFSSVCKPLGDPPACGRTATKSKQRVFKVVVLESITSFCEGISKLIWNTTGTRFVTSHADGLLHAWSVNISYVQGDKQQNLMTSKSDNDSDALTHAKRRLHTSKDYTARDRFFYLGHSFQKPIPQAGTESHQTPRSPDGKCFSENESRGADELSRQHQIRMKQLSVVVSVRKVSSAHPYNTIISK